MTSWAEEEVKTAALGDQRLNKRLVKILDHLGQHPQISIPAACGGWAETLGAYRFFDNEKATFESWSRDTQCPRKERRSKGVDEKESGRWLESYQDSCALQGQLPNTMIVNLADREGDTPSGSSSMQITHQKRVPNSWYMQPRTAAYKGTNPMRRTGNYGKPWNKRRFWATWTWK